MQAVVNFDPSGMHPGEWFFLDCEPVDQAPTTQLGSNRERHVAAKEELLLYPLITSPRPLFARATDDIRHHSNINHGLQYSLECSALSTCPKRGRDDGSLNHPSRARRWTDSATCNTCCRTCGPKQSEQIFTIPIVDLMRITRVLNPLPIVSGKTMRTIYTRRRFQMNRN